MKKNLFIICFMLSIINAYAANLYDHRVSICQNGNVELTIKGKASLFGRRSLTVKKSNQLIIDESYEELSFSYDGHAAETSILVPEIYNDIINFAHKAKPHSVYEEMDFVFRKSDNAIVFQTYSPLRPKFGGDTSAIILELTNSREFVIFDLETQCRVFLN